MEDYSEEDLSFFKLDLAEKCLREFDDKIVKPSDSFAVVAGLDVETGCGEADGEADGEGNGEVLEN